MIIKSLIKNWRFICRREILYKGDSKPIYLVATLLLVMMGLVAYFSFFQTGLSEGQGTLIDLLNSDTNN